MSTATSWFAPHKAAFVFARQRTLATIERIRNYRDPQAALAYRPAPGRAHCGWQLMHVAVTEEVFAAERLLEKKNAFPELTAQFRGGSTPSDDNVPTIDEILHVLGQSRAHLLETCGEISEDALDTIPPALAAREWTIRTVMQVIPWHESHHQGQVHLTLNMYEAGLKD